MKTLSTRQILGILGALLLFAGVFLPAAKAPFLGKMTFMQASGRHGLWLMVIALIALFLTLIRTFQLLWPVGVSALAVMFSAYFNTKARLLGPLAGSKHGLLKGLHDSMLQKVHFKWGLIVLLTGLILIFLAAISGKKPLPKGVPDDTQTV